MKKLSFLIFLFVATNLFATEKWGIHELEFKGPMVDNPFTDVQISAEFQYKNQRYFVEGFYDGDKTYKIRFMPNEEGTWTYTTKSNIKKLDDLTGSFVCTPASENNHGPVSVVKTYHFGYADGTPFYPLGTTAYAWAHQNEDLIKQTLQTLEENAFNKIRMTVMPKQFVEYIRNEPPYYPFEGSVKEGWDFTRFNIDFFRHFEEQVEELMKLGIEADIILFHPYDKWGFIRGSIEENNQYLRYLIARIGAYRNVWWSMANEYDILGKSNDEWEIYFKTVKTYDPYQHLLSIHNGMEWYNYSEPWITHLSVQTPYLEHIQEWRSKYNKPVIDDEFCYEGNVPYNWGNLTAEETVNRFWTIYCRGGYATHGETYEHPDTILWWSKGGKLHGKSPERLRFLLKIMKEAPQQDLVPFYNIWNKDIYLYSEDKGYFLFYYGNSQQISAVLRLPENKKYQIEVIDAWNMTIEKVDGEYSGTTKIPLTQRPYMAVRVKVVD